MVSYNRCGFYSLSWWKGISLYWIPTWSSRGLPQCKLFFVSDAYSLFDSSLSHKNGRRAHSEKTYTDFAVAYHALRTETNHEDHPFVPFGGDFVDIGLRVLMRAASDTLFAFRANHLHGTTPMRCIEQLGVVYPFSERIKVAYKKAQETTTVVLDDVVTAAPGASVVDHHI